MDQLNVSNLKVVPCKESNYIKVSRVEFDQNGVHRFWDYIRIHNGVGVMLFNTTRQAFVLVKQFRPAVYMYRNDDLNKKDKSVVTGDDESVPIKAHVNSGVTQELCAGIVDSNQSLDRIAQKEVLEETGYDVPLENFMRILSWFGNVGMTGNEFTFFYAEVTDDMHVSKGGGNVKEGEFIELRYVPLSEAKQFAFDESVPKPAGLVAAFMWYLWKHKIY